MDYSSHLQNVRTNFPELNSSLLEETEFDLFRNEEFASRCISICITLCNNASAKLNINVNFAVNFNYVFNATATVKNQYAVITFNLGLIEKLETIISDSIELFLKEDVASLTIDKDQIYKLKNISNKCCISYLFYHELAHVLQLSSASSNDIYNYQEIYSIQDSFDIRKHVYEIDADLFGSNMAVFELFEDIRDINNQFSSITLFNLLTALLFTTANVIIEFSENSFQEIYYKQGSHPHPLIRIVKCSEQILSFASKNLSIQKPFFEAILQRNGAMISQINYSSGRRVDYPKLYSENSIDIESYSDEIDSLNEQYKELIRFRSQDLFNVLTN
jgi:hypothetical protein